MKQSLVATLQLINTTPGPNERAMITVQYATFDLETPRESLGIALRHAASTLAICMEMKQVSRLPIDWQVNDIPEMSADDYGKGCVMAAVAKPLTPTMADAWKYAREADGVLHRSPGGYWSISSERQAYPNWGTSTIEGLVSRGAAVYVDWVEGRRGRFPVQVRMIAL